MIYLSQILNSNVVDSSDLNVGKVKDVLVAQRSGYYCPLDFLVVKKGKNIFYIPYEYVENLNAKEVGLRTLISKIPKEEPIIDNHIFLNKHVMDQQIVDVEGARVVRVNDLKLGVFEKKMCVLGIDISGKGLLRRLGIGWVDFLNILKVKLIDWRKAQIVRGEALKLDTISEGLTRLHPADLANIIEDLNVRQGSRLVKHLDAETAAQVFEEIEPAVQKVLVNYLEPEKAAKIIEKMSVDEITDLMQMLPKHEADKFLSFLQNGKLKKIKKLIHYEDDTAGGLMTTDYMSAKPEWTVAETVAQIKKQSSSMRSMLYVYVTDKNGVFEGAISLRRLLIADDNLLLKDLVKTFPTGSTLRVDDDITEVIKIMTKYNLYTAAVLDDKNSIVGMVTIDDVMRCLSPKA